MTKWPMVPLGEVLQLDLSPEAVQADGTYPIVGIYGFGRGLFTREAVSGGSISAAQLFRVKTNQFIYSRLKAFEGAFGLIPAELDGRFVSNEFPTFSSDPKRLLPEFLGWYFRNPTAWKAAAKSSTGIGARRERLKPEQLLRMEISLPSLTEQQRQIEYLNAISAKIDEANSKTTDIERDSNGLLLSAFHQIAKNASRHRLGDVAPLVRRPVIVDSFAEYPGVSVRSFGKGTFHNPPLQGSDITWEKPQLVHAGDVLISNIKAWEGAIAVARPEDDGRYGSHRYLTYVPIPNVSTARFICFFLLTSEGLHHVGEASPGSADRNRTTSAKGLLEIPVPLPDYQQQLWFGELFDKVDAVQKLQVDATAERQALLPAILNQTFNGQDFGVKA